MSSQFDDGGEQEDEKLVADVCNLAFAAGIDSERVGLMTEAQREAICAQRGLVRLLRSLRSRLTAAEQERDGIVAFADITRDALLDRAETAESSLAHALAAYADANEQRNRNREAYESARQDTERLDELERRRLEVLRLNNRWEIQATPYGPIIARHLFLREAIDIARSSTTSDRHES
jgi:hypothetical protein